MLMSSRNQNLLFIVAFVIMLAALVVYTRITHAAEIKSGANVTTDTSIKGQVHCDRTGPNGVMIDCDNMQKLDSNSNIDTGTEARTGDSDLSVGNSINSNTRTDTNTNNSNTSTNSSTNSNTGLSVGNSINTSPGNAGANVGAGVGVGSSGNAGVGGGSSGGAGVSVGR